MFAAIAGSLKIKPPCINCTLLDIRINTVSLFGFASLAIMRKSYIIRKK